MVNRELIYKALNILENGTQAQYADEAVKEYHEARTTAIDSMKKLGKIEQIVRDHDNDSMPEDYWYIDKIREVLNNESNN